MRILANENFPEGRRPCPDPAADRLDSGGGTPTLDNEIGDAAEVRGVLCHECNAMHESRGSIRMSASSIKVPRW